MEKVAILLLLGVTTISKASPLKIPIDSNHFQTQQRGSVVTIDCTNKEELQFVAKTNANFRCAYPEQRSELDADISEKQVESLNAPVIVCGPDEFFDSRRGLCTRGAALFPTALKSARFIRETPTECPPGTEFVTVQGICREARNRKTSLQSEGSVLPIVPSDGVSSTSHDTRNIHGCRPNEVFNSELGFCQVVGGTKDNKTVNVNSVVLERSNTSSVNISTTTTSKPVVISKEGVDNQTSFQSASLVRENQVPPTSSQFQVQTSKDCGPDEIYVAELGICRPFKRPSNPKPLSSDSLVRGSAPPTSVVIQTAKSCQAGEIFVAELGICLPFNRPAKQPELQSSSLVKEQEQLEIKAFETSQSKTDCLPGQIFVSEIGHCL